MPAFTSVDIGLLREVIEYDAETGYFYWLGRKGHRNIDAHGKMLLGINSQGYYRINFNRVSFLAHRVAWALHHGAWPEGLIDHINRRRTDNRIVNLRVVNHTQNVWNSAPSKSSVARNMAVGVRWRPARPEKKAKAHFYATISVGGNERYLGSFGTYEEALKARISAEQKFRSSEGVR